MANQTIERPTLINMALNQLGQPSRFISSNDVGSSEDPFSGDVDRAYQLCLDKCFSQHAWSFLNTRSNLSRHATQPDTGYRYRFDLPGDSLGPVNGFFVPGCDQPIRDFCIEGVTVDCNEMYVVARYKAALEPQYWDGGFRHAFVVALAGMLAVPVNQDLEMRDYYLTQAFGTRSEQGSGGLFGRLIAQDRAQQPVGARMREDNFFDLGRY